MPVDLLYKKLIILFSISYCLMHLEYIRNFRESFPKVMVFELTFIHASLQVIFIYESKSLFTNEELITPVSHEEFVLKNLVLLKLIWSRKLNDISSYWYRSSNIMVAMKEWKLWKSGIHISDWLSSYIKCSLYKI